ncbi:MAG: hypothetical protein K2X34_08565 [Hyphomonadaceae bacterium]|nr:hypothetical protein [Hyphomonadaceae bacterium]
MESRLFIAFAAFVAVSVLFLATRSFRKRDPRRYENAFWWLYLISGIIAAVAIFLAHVPEQLSDILLAVCFALGFFWIGMRAVATWQAWREGSD